MRKSVRIRPEQPGDIEAIARLTELSFRNHPHSNHTEHLVIGKLRDCGALAVSLVAEAGKQVVGHIAFSPVQVADGSRKWYALGPVCVASAFRKRGIGRALVDAGIAALRGLGAEGCVLMGEAGFYERFGFRHYPECFPDGVSPEYLKYFLVLPLGGQVVAGKVSHHAAFNTAPQNCVVRQGWTRKMAGL